MPIETTCPACGRIVRIPDDLIGQIVTCPDCGVTFPAAAPAPPSDRPVETFRESPGPAAEPEPPRRPAPRLDRDGTYDDEDEFDEDDDDDLRESMEERLRARRQRLRGERAKAKVNVPAVGLIVVGAVNILAALGLVGLMAFLATLTLPGVPPGGGGMGFMRIQLIYYGVGAVFLAVFGALILFGGVRMKQRRMYGMALTACVLAIVAALAGCLVLNVIGFLTLALGLTFAIWGIIVLSDPDVKALFR